MYFICNEENSINFQILILFGVKMKFNFLWSKEEI